MKNDSSAIAHNSAYQRHQALYHAVSKQRWSVFQKRVLQFWNQDGALRTRQVFSRHYYLPLLTPLIENTSDSMSVLEVGSGPVCTAQYLGKGNHTYIDPLLDDFRRLFPGTMPEEASYITTMVEKVELPDASFDMVLCLDTLSDVHNPELVLNKVERVLRKNGIFVVSIDVWPSWLARAHFFFSRLLPSLPRFNRLYSYTYKGFSNSLARHFDIVSQQPLKTRFKWLSFKQEWFFVCQHQQAKQHTLK